MINTHSHARSHSNYIPYNLICVKTRSAVVLPISHASSTSSTSNTSNTSYDSTTATIPIIPSNILTTPANAKIASHGVYAMTDYLVTLAAEAESEKD